LSSGRHRPRRRRGRGGRPSSSGRRPTRRRSSKDPIDMTVNDTPSTLAKRMRPGSPSSSPSSVVRPHAAVLLDCAASLSSSSLTRSSSSSPNGKYVPPTPFRYESTVRYLSTRRDGSRPPPPASYIATCMSSAYDARGGSGVGSASCPPRAGPTGTPAGPGGERAEGGGGDVVVVGARSPPAAVPRRIRLIVVSRRGGCHRRHRRRLRRQQRPPRRRARGEERGTTRTDIVCLSIIMGIFFFYPRVDLPAPIPDG
jgi:hypothetical protein